MILPGISGSTFLLIFGLYMPVMSSIKELLQFNFSYLPGIMVFGMGIIAGIFSIVKLIRTLLRRHRPQRFRKSAKQSLR